MSGKRGKGEGYLKRLKNGTWIGQLMDGYTDEGKRNIVNFSARTKAEVLEQMHAYKQQVEEEKKNKANPNADKPKTILFADFADEWYESYRTQVEASTYSNYVYTLKVLKGYFAAKHIGDIKTMEINRFMNWLEEKGYSFSKISKCRAMLIQIFDAAEAEDLIEKNYARRAFRNSKRLTKRQKSHEKDAFNEDEVQILMSSLPNDLMGNSIRLMLITGLRLQELLALTPHDIAEDGSSVTVEKAVKMVDGIPVLGSPKSDTSNRTIPIPQQYRHIAVWMRENCGQAFLWCAPKRDSLLYDTGTVRRRYYRTIENLPGVRRLSPHCCRHTYVTMLQRRGVPMETIARLTGHTDIKTTNGYLHIGEDTLLNAVNKLQGMP